MSPPPDFILSGEYMAHDPHGSSSNFSTLEGEWYCRSKILTAVTELPGKIRSRGASTPPDYDRLSRLTGWRHGPRPRAVPARFTPRPRAHACLRRCRGPPLPVVVRELFNWSIHLGCLIAAELIPVRSVQFMYNIMFFNYLYFLE